MNILFVVPYVPNLIRVRPYNLIRALVEKGHAVTVMTLWSSVGEQMDVDRLRTVGARVIAVRLPQWRSLLNALATLPDGAPLQASYCWHPALDREIRAAALDGTTFDVVHVEHLRGVRYALALQHAARGYRALPIVWDSVDCISYLFEQAVRDGSGGVRGAVLRMELARTRRYEGSLVGQFDRVLVTSRVDKEKLSALAPDGQAGQNIAVLSNGVDLDYFQPDTSLERAPANIVISGKMSYHANVAMVRNLVANIMPQVWAQRPEVSLSVVGKDPPAEIQALAADPRIRVTGTVADIRPYLQGATLAVAPLAYGAGVQNKVLEAMACATPVVTTPQAVAALDVLDGRDLRVAGDAEAFARQILYLLDHPAETSRLGLAGREYVERCHSWPEIAGELEAIYQQVIEKKALQNGEFSG